MKPNTKQQKFVREALSSIRELLNLHEWTVDVAWVEKDEGLMAATCEPSWKYFTALISFYPIFWKETRESQIRIMLHEMCHIFTDPYKDMYVRMANGENFHKDAEALLNEQLTTRIANLAWNAWKQEP